MRSVAVGRLQTPSLDLLLGASEPQTAIRHEAVDGFAKASLKDEVVFELNLRVLLVTPPLAANFNQICFIGVGNPDSNDFPIGYRSLCERVENPCCSSKSSAVLRGSSSPTVSYPKPLYERNDVFRHPSFERRIEFSQSSDG